MAELHESRPQGPSQKSRCQRRAGGHLVLPAGSEVEMKKKVISLLKVQRGDSSVVTF